MPVIHEVKETGQLADRRGLAVLVQYPDEPPVRVFFTGPTHGMGPVCMSTEHFREPVIVSEPSRYGDEFGPEWVRRYFSE